MNRLAKGLFIFLIVCISCTILFLVVAACIEHRTVLHHLKCIFLPGQNTSACPSSEKTMREVVYMVNGLESVTDNYTFIDFGSGEGDSIKWVYQLSNIKNTIGVELSRVQAEESKKLFESISNIHILNINMIDYNFKPLPTILFLYEPLWKMTDTIQAVTIYRTVLDNLTSNYQDNVRTPIYIIYVSGHRQLLCMDFFESFDLLKTVVIPRFLGLYFNRVYLFKYKR